MKDYIQQAIRTEAPVTKELLDRLFDATRVLHGAMGLCTEAGEFQDALKRYIFYGKDIDRTNLIEELGDIFWYIAIICDELRVTIGEVMERNINKLKKRYPEKFSEDDAINRNLKGEREQLEKAKPPLDDYVSPPENWNAEPNLESALHVPETTLTYEQSTKKLIKILGRVADDIVEICAGTVEDSRWKEGHGEGLKRQIVERIRREITMS